MSRNYQPARSINGILPKIIRPVLQRRGFPALALVAQWPQIVGRELAAYTVPERVSWPRRPRREAPEDEDVAARHPRRGGAANRGGERGQGGATLRLRVDPTVALDVEYQKAQILERINTFFGYRAVTALKITQGPVAAGPPSQAQPPSAFPLHRAVTDVRLEAITDTRLRQALTRLNAHRRC